MGSLDTCLLGEYRFPCDLGRRERISETLAGSSPGKLAVVIAGDLVSVAEFIHVYRILALADPAIHLVALAVCCACQSLPRRMVLERSAPRQGQYPAHLGLCFGKQFLFHAESFVWDRSHVRRRAKPSFACQHICLWNRFWSDIQEDKQPALVDCRPCDDQSVWIKHPCLLESLDAARLDVKSLCRSKNSSVT